MKWKTSSQTGGVHASKGMMIMVGLGAVGAHAAQPTSVEEPQLKPIPIHALRDQIPLGHTPQRVDVISSDMLEENMAKDLGDLPVLPNVSVPRSPQRFDATRSSTGRSGYASVNIRGLEGNRVLMTLDGLRLPQGLTSGIMGAAQFGRDWVDMGLVRQVQLQRGASSALWGSDGLTGLVSMQTVEPHDWLKPNQALGGRFQWGGATSDARQRMMLGFAGQSTQEGWGRDHCFQWLLGLTGSQSKARTVANPQTQKQTSLLAKAQWQQGHWQQRLALERSSMAWYCRAGMGTNPYR